MERPPSNPLRPDVPDLGTDRMELLAWLRRNSPSLAELYAGAVAMLENRPPGHVRLIAHAVREIRNRLPEYVSGVKAGGRLNYIDRIDNIRAVWVRAGLVPNDLLNSGVPSIDTTLAVPREAAKPLLELLRDHELSRTKPTDNARRLFVGAAPENAEVIDTLEPIVRHWIEVTDWFMKRAHDNGRCDAECPRDELERQFMLFERTLMAIVRQFYTAVSELDEILEDANS